MDLIWFMIKLVLSFSILIFINSQIILPILFGIPYSITLYIKGHLQFRGILHQFVPLLIWSLVGFILGFLLSMINKNIVNSIIYDTAFVYGNMLSILALLFNFLTKKGRQDMKDDYFNSTFSRFAKTK